MHYLDGSSALACNYNWFIADHNSVNLRYDDHIITSYVPAAE